METTPEQVERYVKEAAGQLGKVEQALLQLEAHPQATEQADQAYRNLISFRDHCGFHGLCPG